uniref:Pre-mRNA-splicing factor SLU7 n=1 Tax=Strongyloides papillosus TaxID=174720 RepID=A0A0N5CE60_STREA
MTSKQRGYLFLNSLEKFIANYNYVAPVEDDYMDYENDEFSGEMNEEILGKSDECFSTECNDEKAYKEFLRITRLHQKQLQDKRREKREKNEPTEVDFNAPTFKLHGEEFFWADKVGVEGLKITSSELPNEQAKKEARVKEKEEMYGSKSLEIMAMETKMTVDFNEIYNALNAPLYPCVSLRIGQ